MKKTNRTISIIFLSFFVVMMVISINVFIVTIIGVHFNSGVKISDYSNNVSIYKEIIQARRGYIYDANKDVIAQDSVTYQVYAVLNKNRESLPNEIAYVDDPEATAVALAPILNVSESELLVYLSTPNVYQVELGRSGNNLSKSDKDKIEALDLNGIEFYENNGRTYPNGIFASHLIGFAQYDVGLQKVTGRTGIELALNDYLTGKNGYVEYQKDANLTGGHQLIGTDEIKKEAENGYDVYLTLDSNIQTILQNGLAQALEEFECEITWSVIMEVKTGKILGYASYPTYDLNKKDITSYSDVPLSYAFEPGSTMKPFLLASLMEHGLYNGQATYKSGLYHVGQTGSIFKRLNSNKASNYIGTIQDANAGKGWGTITFDEGFIRSSNTAMVTMFVDNNMTKSYRDTLSDFGFFQPINFDVPGEVNGNINYTYGMDKITTAFGQGLSVNTLQLMQAYTTFFNKGKMIKPYVIEEIRDPYNDKVIYEGKTEVVGNPISEKTASNILSLMTEVFENKKYGSGRFYKVPEVKMAGKTGTAEIASGGSYIDGAGQNLYSIMAAAPSDDPEIMMFYAIKQANTKNVHTTTTIFKQMFRSILMYLDIHDPDEISETTVLDEALFTKTNIGNYINHDALIVKADLETLGYDVEIIGNGSDVLSQYPSGNQDIYNSQKIFLYTGASSLTMPDMVGWSRKDVIAYWSLTGIPFKSVGDGYVSAQNIRAGESITSEDVIQLVFS